MIRFNAPVKYVEYVSHHNKSFTGCYFDDYKLVVKKNIFGKYVIKVYVGCFRQDLHLDFKIATRNEDIFKEMIKKALKKYPIFAVNDEDLCKYLGIYY